jgi:hypothetical protein
MSATETSQTATLGYPGYAWRTRRGSRCISAVAAPAAGSARRSNSGFAEVPRASSSDAPAHHRQGPGWDGRSTQATTEPQPGSLRAGWQRLQSSNRQGASGRHHDVMQCATKKCMPGRISLHSLTAVPHSPAHDTGYAHTRGDSCLRMPRPCALPARRAPPLAASNSAASTASGDSPDGLRAPAVGGQCRVGVRLWRVTFILARLVSSQPADLAAHRARLFEHAGARPHRPTAPRAHAAAPARQRPRAAARVGQAREGGAPSAHTNARAQRGLHAPARVRAALPHVRAPGLAHRGHLRMDARLTRPCHTVALR